MVIFPWDDSPACTSTTNAVTTEDGVFWALAQAYSHSHAFMSSGWVNISNGIPSFVSLLSSKCPCHPEPLPIGNYRDEDLEVVEGGMGDYNYMFHGCMELTIEVRGHLRSDTTLHCAGVL